MMFSFIEGLQTEAGWSSVGAAVVGPALWKDLDYREGSVDDQLLNNCSKF